MPTPAKAKPQPQVYDVGRMVRDYTVTILHPTPNLATPINLAMLLERLQALTDSLERADEERRRVPGLLNVAPCVFDDGRALDALCLDLVRWHRRLDEYTMHATSIPAERSHDRDAVLWEVTAPLFLGYYGGRTGTEVPLVEGGFPPAFDPTAQHGPDLATPFSLANQLAVYEEFEQDNWDRLLDDLREGAANVGRGTVDLASAVLVGFGLVAGAHWLSRRKK